MRYVKSREGISKWARPIGPEALLRKHNPGFCEILEFLVRSFVRLVVYLFSWGCDNREGSRQPLDCIAW